MPADPSIPYGVRFRMIGHGPADSRGTKTVGLSRISSGLRLYAYEFVAQPVPAEPLLPARLAKAYEFREIGRGHPDLGGGDHRELPMKLLTIYSSLNSQGPPPCRLYHH